MQTNVLSKMLCILCCLIATCIPAMGQSGNYSVKGVLVDSLTNETEPYATVRILSAKSPDKPVKLNVTDENGKFNEKLTQPGDYIITLTSVGKKRWNESSRSLPLKSRWIWERSIQPKQANS